MRRVERGFASLNKILPLPLGKGKGIQGIGLYKSMWVEIKQAKLLMTAEMWKELFEGEGIPTRIMPVSGEPPGRELTEYRILVPEDKKHVIEEVLRKL